jgi:cytochrome c-type biogenesis protein CcmF
MEQAMITSNLIELGHFAAWLAFAVVLVQLSAPGLARYFGQPAVAQLGRQASHIVLILLTIGGAILIYAFVTSNFSVLYVAQHSNARLPLFYKVTALWGGHEGSLYLWAWVLALFTSVVAIQGRRRFPQRLPVLLAVQAGLMLGFLGLILFLSNPFERLLPAAVDGNDLNPLLQDPGMAIHPPMLYLGYVGFSIPFAFAMTALITRWETELWVDLIRRWALIAWIFLTVGIMLGGWWAYYELGWGGYWAWDPVENASFMPWLLGTALIHSITVQEHRHMLHTWNLFLAIGTFALSLLGTFLVRSGVLSSVHAFAVDPGRGLYILLFMGVVLLISFGLFLARGREQSKESIDSFASREALFVGNNVLFSVLTICVMLGTLYPLALEVVSGAKITVGAPYFNAVMVPLFLLVLLLMGLGPLAPWRRANLKRYWQRLQLPLVAGISAGAIMAIIEAGIPWKGPVAVGLVTFVLLSIVLDLWRAIVRRRLRFNETASKAAANVLRRNRRFYGGMTVHLGILIIAIGLVGSGLFRAEKIVVMAKGDIVSIAGHELRFDGTREFAKDNYFALQGRLALLGTDIVLTPERRKYPVQEAPTTESSIHSNWLRDVYVVIGESHGERWSVHLYVNPLVEWIWFGGFVLIAGILIALSQRIRLPSRVRSTANATGSPV